MRQILPVCLVWIGISVTAFLTTGGGAVILWADDFETAVSLNDRAATFNARGEFTSTEALLRQSYALLENSQPRSNSIAGSVLSNLGLNVQQQGRYEQARQLYERASTIIRESKGENKPRVCKTSHQLGAP